LHHLLSLSNPPATPHLSTLSLHDALPISTPRTSSPRPTPKPSRVSRTRSTSSPTAVAPATSTAIRRNQRLPRAFPDHTTGSRMRSEEHTSELQSLAYLVCRLLLEKKKKKK